VRVAAVLGDDPEVLAAQAVADRHPARLAARAPGRLEQRPAARRDAGLERAAHERVQQPHAREPARPPLERSDVHQTRTP
jgi:hypothetical protein